MGGCGSVDRVPASQQGALGFSSAAQQDRYGGSGLGSQARIAAAPSHPHLNSGFETNMGHMRPCHKDTNPPFSVYEFLTKNFHLFTTGVWSLSPKDQRLTPYLGTGKWLKPRGGMQRVVSNWGVPLKGMLKGHLSLVLSFLFPGDEVSTFIPSACSTVV